MPVVLQHNADMELNRVDYFGSVTLAELTALAEYNAKHQHWLTYDCLNIVRPDADFRSILLPELDALFERYKTLYAALTFLILRRSAWLCHSPAAQLHVDFWLRGRDVKAGMSSDVRQFDTIAAAGDWLVLSTAEVKALESGEGFAEVVRYAIPPAQARTMG